MDMVCVLTFVLNIEARKIALHPHNILIIFHHRFVLKVPFYLLMILISLPFALVGLAFGTYKHPLLATPGTVVIDQLSFECARDDVLLILLIILFLMWSSTSHVPSPPLQLIHTLLAGIVSVPMRCFSDWTIVNNVNIRTRSHISIISLLKMFYFL